MAAGGSKRVAELLRIPSGDAVLYCEEVRLHSGFGSKLKYKTIVQFLTENILQRPSPRRLAEIIKNNPSKIPATKKGKQLITKRRVRWNMKKELRKYNRNRDKYSEPAPTASRPNYFVRSSIHDQKRLSEEKLDHCPHGVPRIRVCAICDPDEFRKMSGID